MPFVDLDDNIMNFVGPLVLFGKMLLIGFLIFWVRFTFPRFREDQLQAFAWKFLIPISLRQHPRHHGPEGGVLMPQDPRPLHGHEDHPRGAAQDAVPEARHQDAHPGAR